MSVTRIGRRGNINPEKFKRELAVDLVFVGNESVNFARTKERSRYTDRSGNLTSSIGYSVHIDGQLAGVSSFEPILEGTEGSLKGRELAETSPGDGISLSLVAGMEYASYVEKMGKDVLDSASLIAKQRLGEKIRETLDLVLNEGKE